MGVTIGVLASLIIGLVTGGGHAPPGHPAVPPRPLAALAHPPGQAAGTLTGPPDAVAAAAAHDLLSSAPVVVIAGPAPAGALAAAARRAVRAHAPLLLAAAVAGRPPPGAPLLSPATRAEVAALRPRVIVAAGLPGTALAAELRGMKLRGIRVAGPAARLPAVRAPAPLRQVALLLRGPASGAAAVAAATTAALAGVRVIPVHDGDPQADPADITALAAARPQQVLALGPGFGSPAALAAQVAVARTGAELPGGGQILFPGRRLVALYGHPGAPALGALGQQGLAATLDRARRVAAQYRALSTVPVVPALEIIATVAEGSPGPEHTFSAETPVAALRPWVSAAAAAGMYVILDLQPGRASLLAQAQRYRSLLRLPTVGLALDPEWKLGPRQRPLQQIGSVQAGEVNSVIGWLAALTARNHLPQKLLVLHQFRLSMITGERQLDTSHGDLAIVIHMDGQGTPRVKQQTWDAITRAAPPGVFFGWKDFYVKDHPMLGPRQTIMRAPQPVMISYQ